MPDSRKTTENQAQEQAPSDVARERLLDAMLKIAAERGWTEGAMRAAADEAGLSQGEVELACPGGVGDLLEALAVRAANAAEERMAAADVKEMKIRDKVAAGVRAYIAFLDPHKPAMKRAAGSPFNLFAGPTALWKAADAIWVGLGDKSTDFNWYTKRMTLSAVIGSTLLAWLGTDDEAEVHEFLDHRIENVMQFEKSKKQVQDFVARMPDPFDILGSRRS